MPVQTMRGPSLQDFLALVMRCAGSPADGVTLGPEIAEMEAMLPPPAAEILSRPHFERASLWTLGVSFENVDPDQEPPPQEILIPHDTWIRGVEAQVYPLYNAASDAELVLKTTLFTISAARTLGMNLRGLFEANWRVDARQGFISSGTSEILESGAQITGDGSFSVPLDWRLQKGQTIEVRLRSLIRNFLPAGLADFTDADRVLRWVVITFWGEEMKEPSVQVIR
jgi:hypothetical protein